MTEATAEPGNTRKKTLGGKGTKGRPSMTAILGASPRTPAVHSVQGSLPNEESEEGGSALPTPDRASSTADVVKTPETYRPSISTPASSSDPEQVRLAEPSSRERQPASRTAAPRTSGVGSSSPAPPVRSDHARTAATPNADLSDNAVDDDEFDDDETGHRVSAYLSKSAVRSARSSGMVRGALAIAALDASLEAGVLADLVEVRDKGVKTEGSRFPARRQSRRQTTRAHGANTRVLWQPAFTETEIVELDKILEEVGAKTRSQLISVAVEWFLGPKTSPTDSSVIDLDTSR
ncbi:hypothetical protein [Nocardia noduli]|uniref:hypothetical protein n=1 Tax=Nocardia noduli TaxID=2815722 RepID=UPI001C24E678|nr:hypothetical protein [Nocardia noduli]